MYGYCYYVKHPRRPDQNFVSLDATEVAHELDQCTQLGWPWRLYLVGFRGEEVPSPFIDRDEVWNRMETINHQFTRTCIEASKRSKP